MKILHLPSNRASVTNNAVKALRAHGVNAIGLVFGSEVHPYLDTDFLITISHISFFKGKLEAAIKQVYDIEGEGCGIPPLYHQHIICNC